MKSNNRRLVPALAVALVFLICIYNRTSNGQRHYLKHKALVHPKLSQWKRLLSCGDERSFFEVTGFDFSTFREVVDVIATDDGKFGTIKTGRPKLLSIQDEVGMYLV